MTVGDTPRNLKIAVFNNDTGLSDDPLYETDFSIAENFLQELPSKTVQKVNIDIYVYILLIFIL